MYKNKNVDYNGKHSATMAMTPHSTQPKNIPSLLQWFQYYMCCNNGTMVHSSSPDDSIKENQNKIQDNHIASGVERDKIKQILKSIECINPIDNKENQNKIQDNHIASGVERDKIKQILKSIECINPIDNNRVDDKYNAPMN